MWNAPPRGPKKPRPDFVVTLDVYNGFDVGVWLDAERLKAWCAERDLDPLRLGNGGTRAFARYDYDPGDYAWFNVFVPRDVAPEELGHECLHLAWYVLHEVGVKVSWDNHEALAYLQMHLHRRIAAGLAKRKGA